MTSPTTTERLRERIVPEGSRPSPGQTRSELDQAVTIAVESFARCFRELFPRIEDELFEAAESEIDRTRQSRILDAYGLVRANRDTIEKQFRRSIERIARQRVNPTASRAATAAARDALDLESLELVDERELEADLIVKRMIAKLRQSHNPATTEIDDLDDRLGWLLGKDRVNDEESPFSSDALCRAIRQACDQVEAESGVRLELLRSFESLLSPGFTPAFKALNSHLVKQDVLPDIAAWRRQRFQIKRQLATGAPAASTGAAATLPRAAQPDPAALTRHDDRRHASAVDTSLMGVDERAVTSPNLARTVRLTPLDSTERHASLLDRYSRFRATRPESFAEGGSATPDTFWPQLHRSVIDHLPQLVPSMPAFDAPVSQGVDTPLADLNLIHQVREGARRLGAPRDEEILIDLVALVIDEILRDTQIPDRIKRLIVRLQVPLLKCALLDRTLFSKPDHPARALLDTIARSSIGWQDDDEAETGYYRLVFEIVTTIEATFQRDLAIFGEQKQRLEAFLDEQSQRENERFQRAADLLEQVESREIADMQALEQIRDAVGELELPEEITEFLLDPWRRVLVEAVVAKAHDDTLAALRCVITDLVWSVQPKITPEERQRLVKMLPDLLRRVRGGLASISLALEEHNRFFAGLMNAHSNAIKVGTRTELQERAFLRFEARVAELRIDPGAVPADVRIEVSPQALAQAALQDDFALSVAPSLEDTITRVPVHTPEDVDALIAGLQRGAWAELADREPRRVARLRWISPRRSTYLFTDRSGKEALTYTPELLQLHLEIGQLILLDGKDLTERALDAIETQMAIA